jgi:CBS domain-containing protein
MEKFYIVRKSLLKIITLTLAEIITRPAISAKKHTPLKEIAFEIFYNFFSGVPVTDDDGRVIGVVTEIDLLKQIRAGQGLKELTANDVMTKSPITVDITASLDDVLNIMIEQNVIRIPVTEGDCLVGIVARRDILRHYPELTG